MQRTQELLVALQDAGFDVALDALEMNHELVITEAVLQRWFAPRPTSYGGRLGRWLRAEQVAEVQEASTSVLLAAPRVARPVVMVVVAVAAFTFFGGYERLREGVRKPFLIHSHLFSNGLRVDAIETVNAQGMAATSGWCW